MKSTKYQLLQGDFDTARKLASQRLKMVEDLREEKALLVELATKQYNLIKFVNKIMFDTTRHQRSLPEDKQNTEVLDLAWSTNDCLADTSQQSQIIEMLKAKGIDVTQQSK